MAELKHVAYDKGTVTAEPSLHGADDAPGVQELVDLHPLALVVDDIAVVLDVSVVGHEVLLDEHDKGLLHYLGVELDVVADLGNWQTAELEEDGDDFLGGRMSARDWKSSGTEDGGHSQTRLRHKCRSQEAHRALLRVAISLHETRCQQMLHKRELNRIELN